MYWPVRAANVYALSKQTAHASKITQSHDGLDEEPGADSLGEKEEHGAGSSDVSGGTNCSEAKSPQQRSPSERNEKRQRLLQFDDDEILDVRVSRGGSVFVAITRSSLTVWQTKPTVALTGVVRSKQSMELYGGNTALLLRPDALIMVVQTALGYLIMYSLATDPQAIVYQTTLPDSSKHMHRSNSDGHNTSRRSSTALFSPGESHGIREVNIRFRMVIRIDAGVSKALALEEELVVATLKPSALQCIRWVTEHGASQTSTELLSRMPWIGQKVTVTEMVYDRPMNLATWITNDGRAYAVQRKGVHHVDPENPRSLFHGFCFREPQTEDAAAIKLGINARFSLIAVGCADGRIDVYVVKDYTGNIPLSHKLLLPVGLNTTGKLTCLAYSPDGYCLFAGYEKGWTTWSVYGKLCLSTFNADPNQSLLDNNKWLLGIRNAFWVGGGCELALLSCADSRLWFVDMARNAATGCFTPANISRGLLQTSNSLLLYKGHEVPDVTALSGDLSLWHTIQIPPAYLANQWPIKVAVTSSDGKYIAVAGRRGLAHYSVTSGRWKTFDESRAEQEFTIRGGMCWYQHILIAAIEVNNRFELRLYSREKTLGYSQAQFVEQIAAPAIFTTVSGTESLLVYTYGNTLLHYIIVLEASSAKLVQVGQIGFQGIIRAAPRVRSISWILPEDHLEYGDPSQDVAAASVLFLVDGKLVLLQPSTNEHGELKYDMRVIAGNVEYYLLLRDQPIYPAAMKEDATEPMRLSMNTEPLSGHMENVLRDSLWYLDGVGLNIWSDIQDVLASAPTELGRDIPTAVKIPLDFSPLSTIVGKGIISGIEADLVQRRDVEFSFFRHAARTELFLPQLLRYHLTEFNSSAALHLSDSYQHLPYFSHALEVLLHDVLDAEVDHPPSPPETALLPTVLSFLSSFNSYLDVVVNCTRKTELRSWKTLFSYLPPVLELFGQSIAQGKLNTAAGYLLVLHAFEQDSFQVHEFAQLLQRAAIQQEWELCRELARFLVGIDASGRTLKSAMTEAGLTNATNGSNGHPNGDMVTDVRSARSDSNGLLPPIELNHASLS